MQPLAKAFHLMGVASLLLTSGCATAFVRSSSTVETHYVFPATAFDGQFLWQSAIKGQPLFATIDPKVRLNPVARFACAAGSIIDLPFSIVFDIVLLPWDLWWGHAGATDGEREAESPMR